MIWFTSDTHFGHENVLKFTDRPWETIWQMNDAIVDSINGKVAVDDELYILGDFSFKMTARRSSCAITPWPTGRAWVMDRGTSTDTSTAAAARITSSTASRAFCVTTSVAMPTGTPR